MFLKVNTDKYYEISKIIKSYRTFNWNIENWRSVSNISKLLI